MESSGRQVENAGCLQRFLELERRATGYAPEDAAEVVDAVVSDRFGHLGYAEVFFHQQSLCFLYPDEAQILSECVAGDALEGTRETACAYVESLSG